MLLQIKSGAYGRTCMRRYGKGRRRRGEALSTARQVDYDVWQTRPLLPDDPPPRRIHGGIAAVDAALMEIAVDADKRRAEGGAYG